MTQQLRPSPTESATLFRAGTVRTGNDGSAWVVTATKAGVQRWQRQRQAASGSSGSGSSNSSSDSSNSASDSACVRDFVRYELDLGNRTWRVVQGWRTNPADPKSRTIRTASGQVITVPPEYRRKAVRADWVRSLFCKPRVNEAALREKGALRMEDWIDVATRRHGLTIARLARLFADGRTSVRVVTLHRNTGDVAADEGINPRGRAVAPARFFRNCVAAYTPDDPARNPMRGTLRCSADAAHNWGEEVDFELHVEYSPGSWYPLVDGVLPASDPPFRLLGRRVPWRDLPPRTRVGYRGAMLLLEDAKKMPPVFFA